MCQHGLCVGMVWFTVKVCNNFAQQLFMYIHPNIHNHAVLLHTQNLYHILQWKHCNNYYIVTEGA